MKRLFLILTCYSLIGMAAFSQRAFAIKDWDHRYPTMNNDYPLSFVCWKGWLPPVPHTFIRLYPSHYYYYVNSEPVYDVSKYLSMAINDAIKLILKTLDKNTISKSLEAIEGIKFNQSEHQAIEGFLRGSRLTSIDDVYGLVQDFQMNMQALNYLQQQDVPLEVITVFENDIQRQMENYLMINQMDTKQADKIKAMGQVRKQLKKMLGTITYSTQKVKHFQVLNQTGSHLAFLGQ